MTPRKADQGDYYDGFASVKQQFDYIEQGLDGPTATKQRIGRLAKDMGRRLVMLYGPPGSGKSTLADRDLERSDKNERPCILRQLILARLGIKDDQNGGGL